VTTDGDVFDPSGIINGGYNHSARSSPFIKYQKYMEVRKMHKIEEISDMKRQLLIEHNRLSSKLHESSYMRNSLQENEERLRRLIRKAREIQEGGLLEKANERMVTIEQSKQFLRNYLDGLRRVEGDIEMEKQRLEKDKDKIRGELDKIKERKEYVAQLEIKQKLLTEKVKGCQQSFIRIETDMEHDNSQIALKKQRVDELKQKLDEAESEVTALTKERSEKEQQIETMQGKVEHAQQSLKLLVSSDRETRDKREKLEKQITLLDAKLAKEKQGLTKHTASFAEAKLRLQDLIKSHPDAKGDLWTKAKERLGVSMKLETLETTDMLEEPMAETFSEETLSKLNLENEIKKLDNLKEIVELAEKSINVSAPQAKDQLMDRMMQLVAQKNELQSNRAQIDGNKKHLDSKSTETVLDCFQKVNANLGTFFRSFLPGADAKMEAVTGVDPVTQHTLLTGIEIKVSFNGVWKKSLSELSGGQRSLLALSFLLSMLKYRPSPFYILDEIDAAMDLSHTENIGSIISRHFPQSQFIVISLKDAMFNQANVVYRTSVVDGQSRVVRYASGN